MQQVPRSASALSLSLPYQDSLPVLPGSALYSIETPGSSNPLPRILLSLLLLQTSPSALILPYKKARPVSAAISSLPPFAASTGSEARPDTIYLIPIDSGSLLIADPPASCLLQSGSQAFCFLLPPHIRALPYLLRFVPIDFLISKRQALRLFPLRSFAAVASVDLLFVWPRGRPGLPSLL